MNWKLQIIGASALLSLSATSLALPLAPEASRYGYGSQWGQEDPVKKMIEAVGTDYDWNLEPDNFDPTLPEEGDLLIITTNHYRKHIGNFVHWKMQRGYEVSVATVEEIGNTQSQIKKHITNSYYSDNIRYVILIGDHDDVATHIGTVGRVNGKSADPLYSLIDDDIYPDIYVSRFPVNNITELQTSLNKSIRYERDPQIDGDWYAKASSIASDEAKPLVYDYNDEGVKVEYEGISDSANAHNIANLLKQSGYHFVDEFYESIETAKTELLSESINEGRGLLYYIGHGKEFEWVTTQFENSDINELTNDNMTPVILSVACLNGRFEWLDGDSFAETWLNAGTPEVGRGAVAILASSTVQAWNPPVRGLQAMSEIIANKEKVTLGGIFTNGVISFLSHRRSRIIETFQNWHLFGDATLQMRTTRPERIDHELAESFEQLEEFSYYIEEGVKLTLVQDGRLIAETDNAGELMLLRRANKANIVATISGPNRVPVIKEYKMNSNSIFIKE